MKLLLDTHVVLWSLLEPHRLRDEVAAALVRPEAEKWISPISVWEIAMLAERGRVTLEPDAASWLRRMLARVPVRQAPFDHEVALVSRAMRLSHEDPADRFIAATARVHEMVLVTADRRLLESPDGYAVMPAA